MKSYFEQITKLFKKTPFWKSAAFGLVCVIQEYHVYEALAKDRAFDMSKFLRKTVDRFWKAAATGYSMDEQYILAVEESFFAPANEWEELALQIVQDISDFFYAVRRKKSQEALEMQKRQINLLKKYLALTGQEVSEESELIKNALLNHEKLAEEISAVANKDKKAFLAELQTRESDSLFGNDFGEKYPKPAKKEKPLKKKLPEIRVTSLDFDDMTENAESYSWLNEASPKDWVLGTPDADIDKMQGAYAEYYRNRNYAELCWIMEVKYRIYAHHDYVMNRNAGRVRGYWYLSALTILRSLQLVEKGYPEKMDGSSGYDYEHHKEGTIRGAMYTAYASGADEIIPQLFHFSDGQSETKDLYEIFQNTVPTDELYKRVEQWEDRDTKAAILAVLAGDAKEFRKAVLKMVRSVRSWFDMYSEVVDVSSCACMRLAKERNLSVAPIIAAELLDGNLEFPHLADKWKLPCQDEIDELLGI